MSKDKEGARPSSPNGGAQEDAGARAQGSCGNQAEERNDGGAANTECGCGQSGQASAECGCHGNGGGSAECGCNGNGGNSAECGCNGNGGNSAECGCHGADQASGHASGQCCDPAAEASDVASAQAAGDDKTPDECEQLRAQLADLNDKYVRKCAEFDNFRKRTARERADLIKSAGSDILEGLLPVVDDFERALQHLAQADDHKATVEGIELIYKKFTDYLAKRGVVAIETQGLPLDTSLHEAITMVPAPTPDQKGKIFDCVEKGYKLGDKVLRFAKVVVCQ